MFSEKELQFYDNHNVKRPTSQSHGVSLDDVQENMRRLRPYAWRLEGNKLVGLTDMGPLVQRIPTNVIFMGVDSQGLPRFEKVKLQ